MTFDHPPTSLSQVRRVLSFLLDDIDEAIVALVGCDRDDAKLSGLVNRYMNAVIDLQYEALTNWGIPDRVNEAIHGQGIASVWQVRFQGRASEADVTVHVRAGTECQNELVGLLRDSSRKPEFAKASDFRQAIRTVIVRARRLTQEEVDRAVPPSPERLEATILDYLATVDTPVGERIERDWSGSLSAYDVERLKNLSWESHGPVRGAVYRDLFEAVKQRFPQLPHSDAKDTIEAYLRKQGACEDDIRQAMTKVQPEYPHGVWQEVIDSLLSAQRVCVTIARCTDAPHYDGPRNTCEVTFSLPAKTSEYIELVATKRGRTRTDAELPPSRLKAKAAYEWAISAIPGAEDLTISQLFDAIQHHPSDACKLLPPTAVAFGCYLREAGIKRYATRKARHPTASIRTEAQVERARQPESD